MSNELPLIVADGAKLSLLPRRAGECRFCMTGIPPQPSATHYMTLTSDQLEQLRDQLTKAIELFGARDHDH